MRWKARAGKAVLRRDRLIILGSLVALGLLAWLYLFRFAAGMPEMSGVGAPATSAMRGMGGMPGMDMGSPEPPSPAVGEAAGRFLLSASMWLVMMIGMMLPSASPTILLFAALDRRRAGAGRFARTPIFVLGYFLIWSAFSVVAALAQIASQQYGLLGRDMAVASTLLSGAIFITAGLYEFTPLKHRCLAHCRSPLEWLSRHYREGAAGALRMGTEHGAYCLGCCWVLMLLLFAVGMMNLLWIAALAAIVLVQKLLPGGQLLSRLAGVAMLAWGSLLIAGA